MRYIFDYVCNYIDIFTLWLIVIKESFLVANNNISIIVF